MIRLRNYDPASSSPLNIFACFAKRLLLLAASRPPRGSPPLGGSAIGGGDGDSVSGITAESGKSSKVIKDSFSVVVINDETCRTVISQAGSICHKKGADCRTMSHTPETQVKLEQGPLLAVVCDRCSVFGKPLLPTLNVSENLLAKLVTQEYPLDEWQQLFSRIALLFSTKQKPVLFGDLASIQAKLTEDRKFVNTPMVS